jgi:glycosyltransferase involved in cell wall biosynthesis
MTPPGDPLVTVLCTARDAADHIGEMLESVRAQSLSDWELLVVDDGSTDDTVAIVEGAAASDERVRLVRRSASGGPYAAANEGLRHARGRYVARLDADDVSVPHRLERQVAFLDAHPALRACTADIAILQDGRVRPFRVREIPSLPGSINWGLCVRGFLPSTALFDAEALRAVGGYRELPVSQDHRVWCEFGRRRWLGAIREVLTYWRVHERQLSETKLELQRQLGAEVVRDHLEALGSSWPISDVRTLRAIGYGEVPLRRGFELIGRFSRLWSADDSLTQDERVELTRLTRRLRVEHVRESIRRSLDGSRLGRAALRSYTAARTGRR